MPLLLGTFLGSPVRPCHPSSSSSFTPNTAQGEGVPRHREMTHTHLTLAPKHVRAGRGRPRDREPGRPILSLLGPFAGDFFPGCAPGGCLNPWRRRGAAAGLTYDLPELVVVLGVGPGLVFGHLGVAANAASVRPRQLLQRGGQLHGRRLLAVRPGGAGGHQTRGDLPETPNRNINFYRGKSEDCQPRSRVGSVYRGSGGRPR